MEEQKALVTIDRRVMNLDQDAMSVDRLVAQADMIRDVMRRIMKEGEHYGTIPGTDKAMLYKPGAEKLGVVFRLIPTFEIETMDLPGGHREVRARCILTHGPSGMVAGECTGSCSTMEAKYRYRKAERTCPKCEAEAIVKSKAEYGGGWYCMPKRGGCGERFESGSSEIEEQIVGRVEYDNPADYYNTVLKMSEKRAHSGAIVLATGASDIFAPATDDPDDDPPRTKKRNARQTDDAPVAAEDTAKSAAYMRSLVVLADLSKYWTDRRKQIHHDKTALAAEDTAFQERLAELKAMKKEKKQFVVPPEGCQFAGNGEAKREDCEKAAVGGQPCMTACPAWQEPA